MKLYIALLMLSMITILALSSFNVNLETEFSQEEMIEIRKEVDTRVKAFLAKKRKDCDRELMELVDLKVDTILMFDFKELLMDGDSLNDDTPPRPSPPSKPELLVPNDSTPLQPLIENEDTLFQ